jgi:hypothetical protein
MEGGAEVKSYYVALKDACRDFLDLPQVLPAQELEGAIGRIAIVSTCALQEAIAQYRDLIHQAADIVDKLIEEENDK